MSKFFKSLSLKTWIAVVIAIIVAIAMVLLMVNIDYFNESYTNLVITIIGSCVGFGLALVGSHIIEEINNDKRISIAKANIEDELEFICKKIFYPNGSDEITDEEVYFDTPIWSSVISTGDILRIRKHELFFRAVLASYRRLELLKTDEAKLDWKNLNPKEKQSVISTRRETRKYVQDNLDDIDTFFKKPRKSKEHKSATKKDNERFEKLIGQFIDCAKVKKEFLDEFSQSFGKRNVEGKGLFFSTVSLQTAFAGNARYGIGFGEYDCEIYLSITLEKNKDGASYPNKFLRHLERLDSIKSESITLTEYEFKDRRSYNYSRIVLASNCNKYTCSRNTIVAVTIRTMIKKLLKFEETWLKKTGDESV